MRRSRRASSSVVPLCAARRTRALRARSRGSDALALGSTRALLARCRRGCGRSSFLDAVQGCARARRGRARGRHARRPRARWRAIRRPGRSPALRAGWRRCRTRVRPPRRRNIQPIINAHRGARAPVLWELLEVVATQQLGVPSAPHEAPGLRRRPPVRAGAALRRLPRGHVDLRHAEYLVTLGQLTHDRPLTEALVDEVGVPAHTSSTRCPT